MTNVLREVDLSVKVSGYGDFSAEKMLIRSALEKIIAATQCQFENRLEVRTYPYDSSDIFGERKEDKGLGIFKVTRESFKGESSPGRAGFIYGPYGEMALVVSTEQLAATGKISISVHDPRLIDAARESLSVVVKTLGMEDVVFVKNATPHQEA